MYNTTTTTTTTTTTQLPTIFQLYRGGQLYWWGNQSTTDLLNLHSFNIENVLKVQR
jgi:hypothetical protein